jgi:hypothetical protein
VSHTLTLSLTITAFIGAMAAGIEPEQSYAHDQGVPEWQLVEEFRIGSVSGEGPGALASVGVIAVDDKSCLWVYGNFDSQIKVFDSDRPPNDGRRRNGCRCDVTRGTRARESE